MDRAKCGKAPRGTCSTCHVQTRRICVCAYATHVFFCVRIVSCTQGGCFPPASPTHLTGCLGPNTLPKTANMHVASGQRSSLWCGAV